MKISYQDAIVPAAAAVAVAIRRNPFRPMCTLGTIVAGQMVTDHLRRHEPQRAYVGIRLGEGDIPGLEGQPLRLANSGVNGLALGLAWLLPTMLFRKLPKSVGPAASALTLLGVRTGTRIWADGMARKSQAAMANLGDLGLKDKDAKGGCACGQGGCGCGGKKADDKGGCACGDRDAKADGCCGGHGGEGKSDGCCGGKGKAEGGCGCCGHGKGGHGHGHHHGGHGHGHHGHSHGEPTATTSEAGLLGDAGYAGDRATAGGQGEGAAHPNADGSDEQRGNSIDKAEGAEEKAPEDALAETIAGQTTSPISGRSTMDPQS